MSQYAERTVAWLVSQHLIKSMTSQRKDIIDPEVSGEFAVAVRSAANLYYLYLLTVADIRSTNPSLWNSWKGTLLLELYTATMRVIRRGLANPIDQAEHIAEMRAEARRLLHLYGSPGPAIEQAWLGFPDEYFLRYTADEIAWHTQGILQSDAERPLILIRHQTKRGGTEIYIYTPLDDRMFARATQVFDQKGL